MTRTWRGVSLVTWLIFGLSQCAFVLLSTQVQVSSEASESLLPKDGVAAEEYSTFLSNFISDKSLAIVWENLVCDEKGWALISEVEAEISSLDFVYISKGLTMPGTTYVQANGEDVIVDDFSGIGFETSQSRCAAAINYPPYQYQLISPSQKAVTQIFVTPEADSVVVMDTLSALLDSRAAKLKELGGHAYFVGEAVSSAELFRVTSRDSRLVYLMPFIAALVVLFFTKSGVAATISLASCFSTVLFSYASMAVMGIVLSPITSLVVFLLIPLSVAFTIHAVGVARREDPQETRSLMPFYVACMSTAAGFSVTAMSDAPDLRSLAFLGVLGTGYILVVTVLVSLPILDSSFLSSERAKTSRDWYRSSASQQLLILAFLAVVGLVGLSKLEIDYNPAEYLPATNEVRKNLEKSRFEFGAMYVPVVVSFDEGLDDVARWHRVHELVSGLSEYDGARVVASWYYDDIRPIYSAYTDADDDGNFPSTPEMFTQFYELFAGEDRDLKVSLDEREILIRFQIPFLGSSDYLVFERYLLERAATLSLDVAAIGRVPSFFRIGHAIAFDVIKGLFVVMGAVFLIFFVMFRSLHLALAGTVVNLIPILLGLAVFGFFDVSIDLGSSIVAAIAFGIVLDDSTHYLARYVELRGRGYDLGTAILRCSRELAPVLLATTAAIVLCFLPLFFVELQLFTDFSLLMTITMIIALAADIYILPGLIFLLHK